jgi:hypothetical protein
MSWVILREVSGRWTTEASNKPEKKPDCFYDYRKAINECRQRNRHVAPTSEFDNLFGPLDDPPKGLD